MNKIKETSRVPISCSASSSESVICAWTWGCRQADLFIVGWTTDARLSGSDWWSSRTNQYKQLTIILPDRPKLIIADPSDIFFQRSMGQITVININERDVTQQEALDYLRKVSGEWNWQWNERIFTTWIRDVKQGSYYGIGIGDNWNSIQVPLVSARIFPVPSPDRPWYIHWLISWRKEDRPGLQ